MKRVLLTGGAGSIGYHVINEILNLTDWEIVSIDSFRHRGFHERIQYLYDHNPNAKKRLKSIQHDLVCPISNELKKEIGDVNYILHLAAISDVAWAEENRWYTINNNMWSTFNMYEYARSTSHEAFIYFSTDEVYGAVAKGQAHPEWDTLMASNTYASTKAMGEVMGFPYWRRGEVKLITTNTMNNFGQMQSSKKFPVMVQRWLENDEKVIIHASKKTGDIGSRFYIHSKRVARTLIDILQNRPPKIHAVGEIEKHDKYHIVSDDCLDNLELAQMIAQIMGKELKYVMKDFHKDNPAHDIHYGLENNFLTIKTDLIKDLTETIEWEGEQKC